MDFKKSLERQEKVRTVEKNFSSPFLRPPPGFARRTENDLEVSRVGTMSGFLEPPPGFVKLSNKEMDPSRKQIQSSVERFKIKKTNKTTDQFGLSGLLSSLKSADTNPSLQTLVLGMDLEEIQLDLNEDKVNPSFGDTSAKTSSSPLNIHYPPVPQEYPNMTNLDVKEYLPQPKLRDCTDEWLFYMFYMFPGEEEQMLAAVFLYERDWRFHLENKVWMKRLQGMSSIYHVFHVKLWKKVTKILDIDNESVECNPLLRIVTSLNNTVVSE